MERWSIGSDHHTVAFHATDGDLLLRLTECVGDGLAAGDAVVVVATPEHCDQLLAGLAADFDMDHFVAADQYRDVDASSTLRAVRNARGIDHEKFERLVGSVVATARARGRRVRVVGELVGLAWDEGDIVGALELEGLWNDLIRGTDDILTCAYPADSTPDGLSTLCGICAAHTSVDESSELLDPAEADGDDSVTRLFVPHRGAAVQARRQVEQTLLDWHCEDIVPDAMLLASEIATNSVLHARTPFRLTLARIPGAVRIAVTDGAATMPVRRFPAPDEPGGRGMALVELLSVASGAEVVPGGKVVWAELAC